MNEVNLHLGVFTIRLKIGKKTVSLKQVWTKIKASCFDDRRTRKDGMQNILIDINHFCDNITYELMILDIAGDYIS